jgi:hypothetical protein
MGDDPCATPQRDGLVLDTERPEAIHLLPGRAGHNDVEAGLLRARG